MAPLVLCTHMQYTDYLNASRREDVRITAVGEEVAAVRKHVNTCMDEENTRMDAMKDLLKQLLDRK